MTNIRNRLELTWVGKDQRPQLEPRILLEDPALSYHAAARRSPNKPWAYMLIPHNAFGPQSTLGHLRQQYRRDWR